MIHVGAALRRVTGCRGDIPCISFETEEEDHPLARRQKQIAG